MSKNGSNDEGDYSLSLSQQSMPYFNPIQRGRPHIKTHPWISTFPSNRYIPESNIDQRYIYHWVESCH